MVLRLMLALILLFDQWIGMISSLWYIYVFANINLLDERNAWEMKPIANRGCLTVPFHVGTYTLSIWPRMFELKLREYWTTFLLE
jgi:hypothetical protein